MTLDRALELAARFHAGATDRAGEPYMLHVMRVTLAASRGDPEAATVAALHDLLEDTSATADLLTAEGFSPRVVEAVVALTRVPGEDYGVYISRVALNPLAASVKVLDLADNMDLARLPNPTGADYRRRDKYKKALRSLTPRFA